MKKNISARLFLTIVLLTLVFGCAASTEVRKDSAGADVAVITGILVEDNKLTITSNKNFTYTVYSAADPYKTTIEIPDMSAGEFKNKIISNKSGITEIMPQQIELPSPAVKIEVVLQNPSAVVPVYSNNTLSLIVKEKEPVAPQAEEPVVISEVQDTADIAPPPPPPPFEEKSPDASKHEPGISSLQKATEITGVELKKSADVLRILITGNGSMMPNVFPLDDRIVVDIPDVTLNADIPKTMISPLKGIRAGKHKQKVRLVIDLKKKTNFDVTAIGNFIEISLQKSEAVLTQQPVVSNAKETSDALPPAVSAFPEPEKLVQGKFTGKKLSLDFQDADIIPIFRLLADISGYNIVVHPDVKGKTTLKLINVPWDQALDIILRTFSLSKLVDGNIIRVLPTSLVSKELDDITKAKKSEAEAGELKTKIFPINYADLSKLKDAIDKAKVISSRGNVTLDERGSSIIVNDLEANLAKIDALIKEIDQESMQARQVMIEARIVEVNSNYSKDLGIQWGANFSKPKAGESITIGGTGQVGAAPSGNNFLINMPAAVAAGAPGGAIGFGYINKAANFALDVQLSAMESLQKGKVISSPKIMTMNNQEAKITTGSTIYLQSTASGSNVASFTAVDATLSLTVKPRIAPGGAIFMDIDITKDAPGAVIAGNVSISKNTAKTTVLVNDSDTVVIGGIMTTSEINTNDAVPGLSKIPLLGRLFQKDNKTEEKREVLIFITPRIVEFNSLK